MAPQFRRIDVSQLLPQRAGPFPGTISRGKVASWSSYVTRTFICPSTGSRSPVYVLRRVLHLSSGHSWKTSFHVFSEASDTVAPVSNSISNLTPLTFGFRMIGASCPVVTANSGSQLGSVGRTSGSEHLVQFPHNQYGCLILQPV